MDKIVPAFSVSLLEPSYGSAVDLIELGIDSVLDDGIFKSIPIASLLIGVAKTSQNIHDRNLLRQTLKFIKTFNAGTISVKKLNSYKEKIENDTNKREAELGRVLIILNQTVELKKSEILAKLFRAYVIEAINWDMFCELTDVANRLFLSDLALLIDIYNKKVSDTTQYVEYQAERLISLGLLNSATKRMTISSGTTSKTDKYLTINSLGSLFCRIVQEN